MGADPKKTRVSKTNLHNSKVTSQLIAEQTTAFLKAGGKITKILSGVRDKEAHVGKKEAQDLQPVIYRPLYNNKIGL